MSKRVLDTNRLIDQFRLLQPYARKKRDDAVRCADQLIELHETNAIVSPVEIEIIAGVVDPHEMELTIAFLGLFQIIDKRRILPEDWEEARRIAKHIGNSAKRRDLGDCLITAISNRLRHEVLTGDLGLKRQTGRTRQRKS
jgi:predicted nucleic acid-binding protein